MGKNNENVKIEIELGPTTIKATDETKPTGPEQAMVDVEFKGCSIKYSNADRDFLGGIEKIWSQVPVAITQMVEQAAPKA